MFLSLISITAHKQDFFLPSVFIPFYIFSETQLGASRFGLSGNRKFSEMTVGGSLARLWLRGLCLA